MARNADIRGVIVFGTPAPVLTEAHLAVIAGLREGALRPIIAQTFPLAEAPQAHDLVMSPGRLGKIVLVN
jgi:NADPH2:quinone reductase